MRTAVFGALLIAALVLAACSSGTSKATSPATIPHAATDPALEQLGSKLAQLSKVADPSSVVAVRTTWGRVSDYFPDRLATSASTPVWVMKITGNLCPGHADPCAATEAVAIPVADESGRGFTSAPGTALPSLSRLGKVINVL
jgi:hypothetical protein